MTLRRPARVVRVAAPTWGEPARLSHETRAAVLHAHCRRRGPSDFDRACLSRLVFPGGQEWVHVNVSRAWENGRVRPLCHRRAWRYRFRHCMGRRRQDEMAR